MNIKLNTKVLKNDNVDVSEINGDKAIMPCQTDCNYS